MQLRDIALKNLQRRKSKLLFLLLGMVFGTATIVTLFTLTTAMEDSINLKLRETGSKLSVVPKNETASFSVGGIPVVSGLSYEAQELSGDSLQKIEKAAGDGKIMAVAPKIMGLVTVQNTKLLLVGVDFPNELKIKSWWEFTGSRPEAGDEALVGFKAAERLGVSPGGTLELAGQKFAVSAVLNETGEEEDGIIFANLEAARQVLNKPNTFSFIEVITEKDEAVAAAVAASISQELPAARVKVVKEAAAAREELVEKFSRFSVIVSTIIVAIAALIVTTTMMASVNERTREIGIFRAIGFRKSHVAKIILTEAGIISGVSGFIGYLAGMGIALLAAPVFSDFQMVIGWNPLLGVSVLVGSAALGIAASLVPVLKASRLDPAEALRFI